MKFRMEVEYGYQGKLDFVDFAIKSSEIEPMLFFGIDGVLDLIDKKINKWMKDECIEVHRGLTILLIHICFIFDNKPPYVIKQIGEKLYVEELKNRFFSIKKKGGFE